MLHARGLLWALLVVFVVNTQGQPANTANTPGGLRSLKPASVDTSAGVLTRSGVNAGNSRAGAAEQNVVAADSHGAVDSGQLLFQSIPSFPDTEMRALSTFTGLLRTPSGSHEINHQGGSTGPYRSAADDFIEALLKTTRSRLLDPSLRPLRQSAHQAGVNNRGPVQAAAAVHMDDGMDSFSDAHLPANGESTLDQDDDDDDIEAAEATDFDSLVSTEGTGVNDSLQDSAPGDEQQQLTDLLSAAADADETVLQEDSSTQQIADTASAVEGQVLVTQAEIIPAMQHYGQVVLTSLKMRPMPVQELLTKASAMQAGAHAAVQAAAWQDSLKQALEAAVSLETNTSVTQMHTRMTSILNLGLELAEPPVAYASAAASAVANSVKALTGDDSVLVGVSLIRLGAQPHAHNTSSEKGAAGAHSSKSNPAADVAAKSSMLAMLTLYGVGAPSNAVQIAQRMQESCPSLFVYGASLTNSSCGRTIISNYVAAVLEAEKTQKAANSASASNAGSSAPTRTLLHAAQQASGVSFPISSSRLGAHSGGEQRTNTATATSRAGSTVGAQPNVQVSSAATATASAGASASGGTAANPASNNLQAAEQQDPELAAFLQQSRACLRVRQQPEVNIIVTQAVGVAASQQAAPLADRLQQLEQSPALADLLALSGLTLAQAGKPQVIDLSAAALAAAGLGRGGTLAAASALGSEAAALGHAWASGSSSGSSNVASSDKQDSGVVATPAVIGVAVAVAVSVVAVCIAAVIIVVVKQRTKQARAAAATAADGQLPKSGKRRRSNKGKGMTSKYLPTSHPALACSPNTDGIPPPPCVIVTAVSSPCQHTPGQSPCKPAGLPGLRPAPLASAGSSALLSVGSGPNHNSAGGAGVAARTPTAYAGFLGPAVTRGDSVSSAIMAEFAEQRQQQQQQGSEDGDNSPVEHDTSNTGSEDESDAEGCRQREGQPMQQPGSAVRGTAALGGCSHASSSGKGNLSPLRTLRRPQPAAAAGTSSGSASWQGALPPQHPRAGGCSSPFHQLRQQWEARDGAGDSRSSSPAGSTAACQSAEHSGCRQRHICASPSAGTHATGADANGAGKGTGVGCWEAGCSRDLSAAVHEELRVFSRPLSESSLPDELKAHMTAVAAAAAGPPASAGTAATGSAGGTSASSNDAQGQCSSGAPALPTLRTLDSVSSGNQERPSSSGRPFSCVPLSVGPVGTPQGVRASPFMAYDVSVLLCAATTPTSLQHPSATAAAAAGVGSTSVADSSMQIPQWASSLATSSAGAALLAGGVVGAAGSTYSSCSDDVSSTYAGGSTGSSVGPSSSQGARRATPFMKPSSVPPGLQ